jgi:hypothetical protein
MQERNGSLRSKLTNEIQRERGTRARKEGVKNRKLRKPRNLLKDMYNKNQKVAKIRKSNKKNTDKVKKLRLAQKYIELIIRINDWKRTICRKRYN